MGSHQKLRQSKDPSQRQQQQKTEVLHNELIRKNTLETYKGWQKKSFAKGESFYSPTLARCSIAASISLWGRVSNPMVIAVTSVLVASNLQISSSPAPHGSPLFNKK